MTATPRVQAWKDSLPLTGARLREVSPGVHELSWWMPAPAGPALVEVRVLVDPQTARRIESAWLGEVPPAPLEEPWW